ncbi:hypothetical protein TorRG33x02_355090 [Trema orientale]|uniref:Transmembrane protein n=1 Tax=Trema orientale TaxID=63057 RepID=A0A2P5A9T0_TREOI|nr:hypothetical protein TorRG33x02_355090 [Trema orientale]
MVFFIIYGKRLIYFTFLNGSVLMMHPFIKRCLIVSDVLIFFMALTVTLMRSVVVSWEKILFPLSVKLLQKSVERKAARESCLVLLLLLQKLINLPLLPGALIMAMILMVLVVTAPGVLTAASSATPRRRVGGFMVNPLIGSPALLVLPRSARP